MVIFKNKLFNLILLPAITGILLGLSALPSAVWYLSFIAFIPLLFSAEWTVTTKKPFAVFSLQLLISLVVFYSWVYLWVLQTANLGFLIGYLIIVPNLILVSPFILFKKRRIKFAPVYFIAAWLAAEWIQSWFQLGSPFFNLGHNPGANPQLIQWYEYTGAAGGTLWILTVNFLIYSLGDALILSKKKGLKKSAIVLGVLLLPMVLSIILFNTYKEKGTTSEVMIVHPSTDCGDVKYRINIYELMDIYLGIMLPQLTDKTDYVVLPETAITNAGWIPDLNNNLVFDHFRQKTADFPDLKLITGAITYEAIPDVEKIKRYKKIPGIRYSEKYLTWYYTYNAALLVEKNKPVQMRVKEGLVPYQEFAPYPLLLPRLATVGVDFQFSKRIPNREIFIDGNKRKTASLICYELVFGNKFYKAARKGAEAFFVLLNEGWYTGVPKVSRQFLQLSSVRAIENRRSVVHASNMGISACISQRGEVIARNDGKQSGFLKQEIRMNNKITFASKKGVSLEMAALFTIIVMFMSSFYIKKTF